jgi:Amino acid kinase family
MGVIPIVNENDTIAVTEIKFGDNDTLSAITAAMVHADYLFLMTDVDCLYDKNPRTNPDAQAIEVVDDIVALQADGTLLYPRRKFVWLIQSSIQYRIKSRHRRNVHQDSSSTFSHLSRCDNHHHSVLQPGQHSKHRTLLRRYQNICSYTLHYPAWSGSHIDSTIP